MYEYWIEQKDNLALNPPEYMFIDGFKWKNNNYANIYYKIMKSKNRLINKGYDQILNRLGNLHDEL